MIGPKKKLWGVWYSCGFKTITSSWNNLFYSDQGHTTNSSFLNAKQSFEGFKKNHPQPYYKYELLPYDINKK